MRSKKTVCMGCRGEHAGKFCPAVRYRGQPVVQLLEEADPLDEIYAAAERRGFMDDRGMAALIEWGKADLERRRKATA
jgi:hypothetical protein